jgi:hypothetical protein
MLAAGPIPPSSVSPKKSVGPVSVEVRLADGSLVRMTPSAPAIEIATRYGTLTIPVEEIRRIEFAFRVPEQLEKKIAEAVVQLGNPTFRVREAAGAELLTYREMAYPALKRATSAGDAEVASRAEELIRRLEERLPPEKLKFREHDLIVTTDFPVRGRIEMPTLKAHSPHFGEVSLPLADLRTLRSLSAAGEVELTIDAARYGTTQGSEWLATEIELSAGMTLSARASGIVDLYPSGGNYKTEPDGQHNFGQTGGFTPGALLGRIGANGVPFIIGSKYNGIPNGEGTLYLRIVGSPWNNAATGAYAVKIVAEMGDIAAPRTNPRAPESVSKDKEKEFKIDFKK